MTLLLARRPRGRGRAAARRARTSSTPGASARPAQRLPRRAPRARARSSRATSPARAARARAGRADRRPLRRRPLLARRASSHLLVAEGRCGGRARAPAEARAPLRRSTRARRRAAGARSAPRRSTGSAGTTRRSRSPRRRSRSRARWGAPGALGNALRVLGTLRAARTGSRPEEAVAVLDGSPARLELAKALAALGGALRRDAPADRGARAAARARSSWPSRATRPGSPSTSRTELYATGARPRTDALAGRRRRSRRPSAASSTLRRRRARRTATSPRRCS